jgi:hypothetical protein
MRFVFLTADLETRPTWWQVQDTLGRLKLRGIQRYLDLKFVRVGQVFGGTLNLMRHCQVAQNCGAEAVLATMSGRDTYGDKGVAGLSYISWHDRRPDDICIVPDFVTSLIGQVKGSAIAYLQNPLFVKADFNFRSDRVTLWTDSPLMLEICQKTYLNRPIQIVPNIIDNIQFPFIPQSDREAGLIFAFPRKGKDYIDATQQCYESMGGKYWRFERIDGLSIQELAQQFRRPQAFLASADIEGCALPPQESMASGIVVVGKDARGANFCMADRETAMIADTPEAAARSLLELENSDLRERIAQNAYRAIKRYFPHEEPTAFWRETIRRFGGTPTYGSPTYRDMTPMTDWLPE